MKYIQFKSMDLVILSILAFASEFLGYFLVEKLETPFYLTFSLAVCIIAMVRWGAVGVITYVVAGVSLFILKDTSSSVAGAFCYEIIANVAVCIPFLFFINKNKNDIVSSMPKFIGILLLCFLSLTLAKGIVLLIIEQSITGAIEYFGYSLLVNLMNVGLLVLLVKTKSQLLTDMKIYLTVDCQKQEEAENE